MKFKIWYLAIPVVLYFGYKKYCASKELAARKRMEGATDEQSQQ